ncbi:hypothetical protein PUN28_014746 [Cardiocondyla obscurior]|uniref:Uncharacterized protein n=1 Tax=Cardiocondyla obscurior TaxID=286306 RepID=A0AAW2EV73_9HYME
MHVLSACGVSSESREDFNQRASKNNYYARRCRVNYRMIEIKMQESRVEFLLPPYEVEALVFYKRNKSKRNENSVVFWFVTP